MTKTEIEFLRESNAIEGEFSNESLSDAKLAWAHTKTIKKISINDILETHEILMINLNYRIAGRFRDCAIRIGMVVKENETRDSLSEKLKRVVDIMNVSVEDKKNLSLKNRKVIAKTCHIMFEKIHPFEDGNGRVGRIIWNWHRKALGLGIRVIHVGEEQLFYYKWFK